MLRINIYFCVCFFHGGLRTELIYFSLTDFADASKIFRHSITQLCIQGLTAVTLRLRVEIHRAFKDKYAIGMIKKIRVYYKAYCGLDGLRDFGVFIVLM